MLRSYSATGRIKKTLSLKNRERARTTVWPLPVGLNKPKLSRAIPEVLIFAATSDLMMA
jgi:hypothetical protein